MMTKVSLITAASCLTLSGMAAADFTGFELDVTEVSIASGMGAGDYYAINLFGVFDNANDLFLNVYNFNVVTSDMGGFEQWDASPPDGTWSPTLTLDIPAAGYIPAIDSYVLAGGVAGPGGSLTALDPGFGTGSGAYVPENAGWYVSPPTAAPGPDVDGRIAFGQFVVAQDRVDSMNFFQFDGEVGYKDENGTTTFGIGGGSWGIPAPGALALLGLGGLVARRRRA